MSKDRKIVNDELVRMWKETTVASSKIIFADFLWRKNVAGQPLFKSKVGTRDCSGSVLTSLVKVLTQKSRDKQRKLL